METKKQCSVVTILRLLPLLVFFTGSLLLPAAAATSTAQPVTSQDTTGVTPTNNNTGGHGGTGVHVISWNLEYVWFPLSITSFALFVGLAKIGFHHADFLSAILPESVLLIVMGVIYGGIAYAINDSASSLESQAFFLFYLPPIILEASYALHDRTFADNVASILMYAVVGTLLNTFLIGFTLFGFSLTGAYGSTFTISLIECLVFSSLISAVDPVAVLAIFQEIRVNQVLYFLVFGESLLNDAVTVVLYNMMNSLLTLDTIPFEQILLGVASFFTVSLGGLLIGLIVGILSSILTRFTEHVRVVEPLAILSMAYLSYLLAELFHFSGIISIICCGLAQAQYAFANISQKSKTTVIYFIKMFATLMEALIFLQLGETLWAEELKWNTGFVLLTLFFIFIYRALAKMFAGMFVLYSLIRVTLITYVINKVRLIKVNKEEQFIMSYGGLRGAVAFSLVATLKADVMPIRDVLVTTTLVVILFTVFVQGITIKPLVKFFRIKRMAKEESSVTLTIHQTVMDYMMAGIEEVIGHKGHNSFRVWIEHLDTRYMKKILQREPQSWEDKVMEIFEEIIKRDHHKLVFKLPHGEVSRKSSEADMEKFKPMLTQDDSYCEFVRRRARTLSRERPQGEHTTISDKPTSAELAGIIRRNPVDLLHQRYDKNLLMDDSQDLPMLMRQRSESVVKAVDSAGRRRAFTEIMREVMAPKTITEEGRGGSETTDDERQNDDAARGYLADGYLVHGEKNALITSMKDEARNHLSIKVDLEDRDRADSRV